MKCSESRFPARAGFRAVTVNLRCRRNRRGSPLELLLRTATERRLRPADRADHGQVGAPRERSPDTLRCRFMQNTLRLVGVLVILLLVPVATASNDDVQPDKFSDWNRIETIPAGVRTTVRFLDDGSSKYLNTKGRFSSFSETSIVLELKDGTVRAIQRDTVQDIRVRRPFFKRKGGWILGIGSAVVFCAIWTCDGDITPVFMPIFTATYAVPLGLVGALLTPTRLVYRSSVSDD